MLRGRKCPNHDFFNTRGGKVLSIYCLMRAEKRQTNPALKGTISGTMTNQFFLKLKHHMVIKKVLSETQKCLKWSTKIFLSHKIQLDCRNNRYKAHLYVLHQRI